ncbi:LOG family protein [Haloferula sp. BvORR071]|uniref:LOG family protein n=1 Tax=Haloferula sp. BvORR071 TaxID=1396141 RepID=UPI000556910F|nr:LOG family protein [Haloferula sp. BvORR071]
MPKVRLSGTVLGTDDPGREARARLLYLLFSKGWDIYNSNGDQRITLSNIERKIIEAESFVFTPGATLEDMFKAISIFVGYQTLDRNLAGKPTVILNTDASWNPFFAVLDHLNKMGTIKQDHRDFLLAAESPEDVIETLDLVRMKGLPDAGREKIGENKAGSFEDPVPADYIGNVCVFCSATLEDPGYLADGRALGRTLAENRLGCVSGAGRSGIMGAVVEGSVGAGGWTAGSNVPHIIELEGLPDGLSSFWLRPDIYTRMEVMIENSDAFVIFPGGAGTVQELLALMIFKHQGNPLMVGKPVILFNRENADGVRFWDPLIGLLGDLCEPGSFGVAESLDGILPLIREGLEAREPAEA